MKNMFILFVEFNFSNGGIWKQITQGYTGASRAGREQQTVAAINTNAFKLNVYLVQIVLQMGTFA